MAMKVLNWLHRKLNVRDDYSPISPHKDEIRESITERDTEALLLHDILLNGILTIGTLGHDHQSFLPQDNFLLEEKKTQETPELPVEEIKPLSRVESVKMKPSSSVKGSEFNEKIELVVKKIEFEEDRVSTQEKPLLMHEEKREIKTRTTLAELFEAEVFVKKDAKEEMVSNEVLEVKERCEIKEEKKKKKKEERFATTMNNAKKLNRLMRKMLRKKIYPDHLKCGEEPPVISS